MYRTIYSILLFVCGSACVSCLALSDEPEYMLVTIDGQKCGYAVNQRIEKGGMVHTSQEVFMSINRLGFILEVTEKTVYVETAAGEPVSFETTQKFSDAAGQVTRGKIADGKLTLMRTDEEVNTLDYDRQALMPEGLRLLVLKNGIAPGVSFSFTVFDAALVQNMPAKVAVFDKEKIDLFGRIKELYKVVTTTTIPGAGDVRMTSYVDEDYKPYRSSTWLMGFTIEMIACEKAVALSPNSPADIFSDLLIKSPVNISQAALKLPITYTLEITKPSDDVKVPSDDNQTAEKDEKGNIVVRVAPVKNVKGEPWPVTHKDPKLAGFLAANGYVQSDNEKIKALAKKAVGNASDTLTAAHNIEEFVHGYISSKNLSAGYATALEVLESKEGDCTEHAVLTAALCRSAGIPAKVACGIIYAEAFSGRGDIFGGHAWTLCYVGGKWIGLDASTGRNGYSSGHIKLAEGDGRPEAFFSLINLLGNFKITKIETSE